MQRPLHCCVQRTHTIPPVATTAAIMPQAWDVYGVAVLQQLHAQPAC